MLDALGDMKAVDVKALDVRGITDITDTMVVASGTSDRHVKSIADRVVQRCKEAGFRPYGIEGERDGEWVLLDLQRRRAARDVAAGARVLRTGKTLGKRAPRSAPESAPRRLPAPPEPACACAFLLRARACRRWVDAGFEDYAGRLRGDYRLELVEIALGERGGGDTRRAIAAEGKRMLAAAGERAHIVALQVGGKALTTPSWLVGSKPGPRRARHRFSASAARTGWRPKSTPRRGSAGRFQP